MALPYRKILVPLDGSPLAEAALDDASAIAAAFGAELTLLQVMPPDGGALEVGGREVPIDEKEEMRRASTLAYLDALRARVPSAVRMRLEASVGVAPDAIVQRAHDGGFDLIVMGTHGRSGFKRWVLGSVADHVVRHAQLAVLLVTAPTA
jgi:nucleotide-binding universal stress UspA family protein